MNFSPIPEALQDFKEGKFLVVLDNEDRENEGDLIAAAEFIDPTKMAFLVKHSSGYVCAPLSPERADQLDLPLMVARNESSDPHGTAYTVTCDVKRGTTTGISATDRAKTCLALSDPSTKPDDLSRPGHIVPLRAVEGGILTRQGHTEAAIDLCRLNHLQPAAVICELVRDDNGEMARRDYCLEFAKKYSLRAITIDALAKYIR